MTEERIPREYKPISPLGYVCYNLLFSLPVIGFFCLIAFCFSDNINVRNYAKSFWVFLLLGLLLGGIVLIIVLMNYTITG